LSGLPSMLIILLSLTLTIWPQPTAQYGQTLGTSLAPAIFSRRTSAWAACKFSPAPSNPPKAKPPEVRRNSRRLGADGIGDMANSSERIGRSAKKGGGDVASLLSIV